VIAEPVFGKVKDLILAQSGARLGFINYLWAFNNNDPYIDYDNEDNFYSGIIFINFKKR
jgi:hypothetical protein